MEEPDPLGEEYSLEELVPLPAKCPKCKRAFLGKDAIRAPCLDHCHCWYCHTRLVPHPAHPDVVDAKTRRRLKAGLLPFPE